MIAIILLLGTKVVVTDMDKRGPDSVYQPTNLLNFGWSSWHAPGMELQMQMHPNAPCAGAGVVALDGTGVLTGRACT